MNCTYIIRRPGNTAWDESIESLAEAADQRALANRTCCPGHEIYAAWGDTSGGEQEVTEVDEDDVQAALAEREAIAAAARS